MDLATVTSFRRARTRDDLRLAPGETVLAGGTWLMSEPQPGTTGLVDLSTLGWAPWAPLPGGGLRVGATCTIEQVQAAPWPAPVARLARDCADALVMSSKVQHTATVGGNVCLALPAAAMVSLFGALDAEAVVWTATGGERHEPVTSFVTGPSTTTLRPGEVLRALDVPASSLTARYAFRREGLTALGRSGAVVVGRAGRTGVVLTVTAATERPVVVRTEADLAAVDCWYDDPHGPTDWRAAVTGLLAREVWEELS